MTYQLGSSAAGNNFPYQPGTGQSANPNGSTVQTTGHPNEAYISNGAPNGSYGYHGQSQYPYHQNYYIPPQPALTATTGTQVTYQLQEMSFSSEEIQCSVNFMYI